MLTLKESSRSGKPKGGRPKGYILNYRPQQKTQHLLGQVGEILSQYDEHLPLTVRQIFYVLVGQYCYEKNERFYKKLCGHLANARRAGVVAWSDIRDDRVAGGAVRHYADVAEFLEVVRLTAELARLDLMLGQGVAVEVWCEAAGMVPQLERVAHRYSIPVYSTGGFEGVDPKHDIAGRMAESGCGRGVVLQLGDYDPAGESMHHVIAEDVGAFLAADAPSLDFRVIRVALTPEQIARHDIPTAANDKQDGRSLKWTGTTCQLEALSPDLIAAALDAAIQSVVDMDLIDARRAEQPAFTQELLDAIPERAG